MLLLSLLLDSNRECRDLVSAVDIYERNFSIMEIKGGVTLAASLSPQNKERRNMVPTILHIPAKLREDDIRVLE